MPLLPRFTPVSRPLGDGLTQHSGFIFASVSSALRKPPCPAASRLSPQVRQIRVWPPASPPRPPLHAWIEAPTVRPRSSAPSAAQLLHAATDGPLSATSRCSLQLWRLPLPPHRTMCVCECVAWRIVPSAVASRHHHSVFLFFCASALSPSSFSSELTCRPTSQTPSGSIFTAQTLTHLLSIALLTSVTPHLSPPRHPTTLPPIPGATFAKHRSLHTHTTHRPALSSFASSFRLTASHSSTQPSPLQHDCTMTLRGTVLHVNMRYFPQTEWSDMWDILKVCPCVRHSQC
jgi:hypothetical protein